MATKAPRQAAHQSRAETGLGFARRILSLAGRKGGVANLDRDEPPLPRVPRQGSGCRERPVCRSMEWSVGSAWVLFPGRITPQRCRGCKIQKQLKFAD